jgi:hypothetical protein
MKAYLITTGILFALLTLAHIWRLFEEGQLGKDPWYVVVTLVAAAMSVWAFSLLRPSTRRERSL